MYHTFVKWMARKQFERINQGDIDGLVQPWAPQLRHTLAGDHALGGTRRTPAGGREWFERLFRLFPDLHFDIKEIAASGTPRNTVVMVEWAERSTLPDGQQYANDGVHVICIRNGKVVRTDVHLDTAKLTDALDKLAAQGVEEAHAPPIEK